MPYPSHPSQDVETVGPAAGDEPFAAVAGPTRVGPSQDVRILPPQMSHCSVPMDIDRTAEVGSGRALLPKF